MCGIAGFLDPLGRVPLEATGSAMTASLHHRGPDDRGLWSDSDAGIALGHARLSIVDLSPAGHQPMVSANGRWVIVYNGEIYNAGELRRRLTLSGISFRGHSDTEAILEAVAAWGIEDTVKLMIGMFAFAVWDRLECNLYLARDRLGIKPLYWGRFGQLFLFGSELKALRAHPGWKPEIDRDALVGFMRHSYVPAPLSIFNGIAKLKPGHILTLRQDQEPEIQSYWDLRQIAVAGVRQPSKNSDRDAEDKLDGLLRDAVGRRMVADVPLGALLSGGVDSSLVVALMQAQAERPVKTYSIGFREQAYDEASYAKKVAKHLGTDHTELYVEPEHALEILPQLSTWYDEPFADASQIPTYLVSEMTRHHVTVALSGDGGDELFAGYNRYFWARAMRDKTGYLPLLLRQFAAGVIESVPPSAWDQVAAIVPGRWRPNHPGDKLHKLAAIMKEHSADAIFRWLISQWQKPTDLVIGGREPVTVIWDEHLRRDLQDFTDRMQYLDTVTYLPDDILTKVDRASMAVGLEARVPLLDHRVVEFAWSQPGHRKIRDGQGKWLLRQVLYRYVPRELIERPKMGFGVPIDSWLRGPLREWAEDLLDEREMRQQGYLNPEPVQTRWKEHLSGRRNWQYALWNVLIFQQWLRHYHLA